MRERFIKIQTKLPILFSLMVVLLVYVIEIIVEVILSLVLKIEISKRLEYLIIFVANLFVVFVVAGRYIFSAINLKESLKKLIPLISLVLILFGFSVYDAVSKNIKFNGYFYILKTLVGIFVLVVREELIYRGVLCNSLILKAEINKKNVIKIIVLDGIVFGFAHIINVVMGIPFKAVVVQAIGSCFFGMLMATLYFSSRNIYIPILVHFANNFTAAFDMIFIDSNIQFENVIATYDEMNVLIAVMSYSLVYIFLIYWFFVRKGKIEKLVENAKHMKEEYLQIK